MPRLLVALALVGSLLLATGTVIGVAAAPPATQNTFTTIAAAFSNIRMVGADTCIELTATVAYTGRLTGTSTVRGDLIIHPDGSAVFFDIETFTGTVNGVAGVVTFYLNGTGSSSGGYQGTAVVVHGTGALATLHGALHQVGTVPDKATGPLGTYAGQLHTRGAGRDE